MARTKGTPIRRETSSEYISKHDRTPRNATASKGAANGNLASAEVPPISAVLEKNNGLLQVAIAVGGIYGSLWVPCPCWSLAVHHAVPCSVSRANRRDSGTA